MDGFKKLMSVFITVTVVNFLLFFLISLIIGGTAVNGKVVDDHYYVGDHGEYREVPRSVYDFSRFHSYSVIVTFLFLGGPATTYLLHELKHETAGEKRSNE